MVPDVKVALERAQMTTEINNLTAQGNTLLLKSVATDVREEADKLYTEALGYLDKADEVASTFAERFPNSLNLCRTGA